MTANDDFDFSIKTAPTSWNEAAPDEEQPTTPTRRQKPRRTKKLPSRKKADLFSASFLGIAVSLVSAVGWYLLDSRWDQRIWWAPAAIGLLLAVAVRISAGAESSGLRCGLSFALYSVTVLVAGSFIARRNLLNQRATVDFESLESQLTFDLFSQGDSITGLVAGLVAIIAFSVGLSNQKFKVQ